ncbi:hypothetical protein D3C81_1309800 [compost metagenome]
MWLRLSCTSRKRTWGMLRVARIRPSSTSLLPEITPYSEAGASWLAISCPVWFSSWRKSWIRTKVKKLISNKVSSRAGPRLMIWVRV